MPLKDPNERTFVFADLSGFTAMTESHGDDDAAATAIRFGDLARSCLADDVRLVKTIGDAVMLVAPQPAPALQSAIALRSAVQTEPRFPLLRTGIHHGPCVEHDGDYFGAAVNLAARVASHAQAGQLLVTPSVVAAAKAMPRVSVRDLGRATFKNVSSPVNVFEVICPDAADAITIDPVCRMRVKEVEAVGRFVHGGRAYVFCSDGCARTFLDAPERYEAR
jgi:adenylate cyclase